MKEGRRHRELNEGGGVRGSGWGQGLREEIIERELWREEGVGR